MDEDKGTWAETAEEGIVPDKLSGDDDAPETGRTTGSNEPATEDGIDRSAGDNADAVTDGGPRDTGDLKDVGAKRGS